MCLQCVSANLVKCTIWLSIILEFFSFNSYVLDFGLEGGVLGLGLGLGSWVLGLGLGLGSCGLGLGLGLEVCVLGLALALGVMSLLTSLSPRQYRKLCPHPRGYLGIPLSATPCSSLKCDSCINNTLDNGLRYCDGRRILMGIPNSEYRNNRWSIVLLWWARTQQTLYSVYSWTSRC